jgi:hypothetical protein
MIRDTWQEVHRLKQQKREGEEREERGVKKLRPS